MSYLLALGDFLADNASLLIGAAAMVFAAGLFLAALIQKGRGARLIALILSLFSVVMCVHSFRQAARSVKPGDRSARILESQADAAKEQALLLLASGAEGRREFLAMLPKAPPETQNAIFAALRQLPEGESLPVLFSIIETCGYEQIARAARTLGEMGPRARHAVPVLSAIDGEIQATVAAAEALSLIDPQNAVSAEKLKETLQLVRDEEPAETAALTHAALRMGVAGGGLLIEVYPYLQAGTRKHLCNAVANPGEAASVEAFAVLLRTGLEPLRLAALQGAAKLPQPAHLYSLVLELSAAAPPELRLAALTALPDLGTPAAEALPAMAALLSPDAVPHPALLAAIARYGDSELLRALIRDQRAEVAESAMTAVSRTPDRLQAINLLTEFLGDEDSRAARNAADALRRLAPADLPLLLAASAKRKDLRGYALHAIESSTPQDLASQLPALAELLRDRNSGVYDLTAQAVARLGASAAPVVPQLAKGLRDRDIQRCLDSADALHKIGTLKSRIVLLGFTLLRGARAFWAALLQQQELFAIMLLVLFGYGLYCAILYRRGQRTKMAIVAVAPLVVLALFVGGTALSSVRNFSACPLERISAAAGQR